MNRFLARDSGFSLLEVVVGLLLLGLLMLGMASTLVLGSRIATGSSLLNQATVAAESALEELRSLGYAELSTFPESTPIEWGEHQEFSTWVTTEPYPLSNVIRVTITVEWQDRGYHQSLTITSLVGSN